MIIILIVYVLILLIHRCSYENFACKEMICTKCDTAIQPAWGSFSVFHISMIKKYTIWIETKSLDSIVLEKDLEWETGRDMHGKYLHLFEDSGYLELLRGLIRCK